MVKIEKWIDHKIRFVLGEDGEWWGIAKDVAEALGYDHTPSMVRRLDEDEKSTVRLTHSTKGGNPNTTIISETGIYEAIFGSKRKEAKEFKKWVKQVIKTLRQQSGLEGFAVFRMMDKEHQKNAMEQISQIRNAKPKHYMKANSIANKVVSDNYGFEKMVKKDEMTPEMLRDRQPVLDDTVDLMKVKENLGLDVSIKEAVRRKWIKS